MTIRTINRFSGARPSFVIPLATLILLVGLFSLVGVCTAPLSASAQYQAAPLTVTEPVARQLLMTWLLCLERNDIAAMSVYYADPRTATPWKQRIDARKVVKAGLVQIHSINPTPDKTWGGVPLSGEVRFTIELQIEGYAQPILETRDWGLTNINNFLQVATELREKEPAVTGTQGSALFPTFSTETAPVLVPPPPSAPTVPTSPVVAAPATPAAAPVTPKAAGGKVSGPLTKDLLIEEVWHKLMIRFRTAWMSRSEPAFIACFLGKPVQPLKDFRRNIEEGTGQIAIPVLEIDYDSVKGSDNEITFTFRYKLWGNGVKDLDLTEVTAKAVRSGATWMFKEFDGERMSDPRNSALKQQMAPQQKPSMFGNLFSPRR